MNYARATATMDYSIASGCVKVGDRMHMWLLLVFKIRLHTQQQQRSTEEPLGQFAMRKYCKTITVRNTPNFDLGRNGIRIRRLNKVLFFVHSCVKRQSSRL